MLLQTKDVTYKDPMVATVVFHGMGDSFNWFYNILTIFTIYEEELFPSLFLVLKQLWVLTVGFTQSHRLPHGIQDSYSDFWDQ